MAIKQKLSLAEALEEGEKLHARSAALRLIACLRAVSNGAISAHLLSRENIQPLRDMLNNGVAFVDIIRATQVRCYFLPAGQIKSWRYLDAIMSERKEETL